jgi:hypothetical protein
MTRDEIDAAEDADGERRMQRLLDDEHEARLRAAPPSAAPTLADRLEELAAVFDKFEFTPAEKHRCDSAAGGAA